MNPFINKLYYYYTQLEILLNSNRELISDNDDKEVDFIRSNIYLLGNIRQCLLKKQYSNAKLIIDKLEHIDHKHVINLNEAIEEIEQANAPYDLNFGIPINDPATSSKELKYLVDSNSQIIEILSQYSGAITNEFKTDILSIKAKIESLEQSIIDVGSGLTKISNCLPENDIFIKMHTSVNTLNTELETINSSKNNITEMNSNIHDLLPTIEQIRNQLNIHLQAVNTDFSKVMSTYRDQTINSVNEIKKSTIDTASMIMHDLPKQVGDITAQIPDKVSKSMTRALWSNYIVFILGFFVCVIITNWFMGERVGRTMQKELYNTVYNSYAIAKEEANNKTKIKH